VEVQLRWVEVFSLTSQFLYCQGNDPNYLFNRRLHEAQNWSGGSEGATAVNLDENPTTISGGFSTHRNRKSCLSISPAELIFRNAPHRSIELAKLGPSLLV